MNYIRRLICAVVIVFIIITSWYGAEIMIHGTSQRSAVDIAIAVIISLVLSGKIEKGAEENERRREIAERFATEFAKQIQKGEKVINGKDGSGKES